MKGLVGAKTNPRMQFIHDLCEMCDKLRTTHKCHVIVTGDFNVNLAKKTPAAAELQTKMEALGIKNAYTLLHPSVRLPRAFICARTSARFACF